MSFFGTVQINPVGSFFTSNGYQPSSNPLNGSGNFNWHGGNIENKSDYGIVKVGLPNYLTLTTHR